jgi:ribosome-associated toxin RatA of RatAB toxin-antitoxin module
LRTFFASCALVVTVAGVTGVASAKARPWPLTTLPADKLLTLVPSLGEQDLALIESDARGMLKQISTMTLVAAPPSVVHDVVAHPERYGQFVHNMSRSDVRREAGGTIVHEYKLDYTVASVDGRHRYVFLPAVAGQAAPPIDVYDPDDNGTRHYRWEFYAPPDGQGTLVVMYGYSQIPADGIYGKLMKRAQTLEYGLALIPQITLMLAVKQRAEQLSPGQARPSTKGPAPNLGFLLERGAVALFRKSGSHVTEVNLVDRTRARPDMLVRVAANTASWSKFVPTISRSTALGQRQGLPATEIEQSLPLMSWTTTWGVFANSTAVDMFGLDGDLTRARMRWDVRPLANAAPMQAEIVLRAMVDYDHGSVVVRELYKLEPLFQYGIDVGLQLVILRGIKQQAEQLSPSTAAR